MNEQEDDGSVDKYYQIIGDLIAIRRRSIKMRQEDMAKAIGLTRTSIVNIEAGRQRTAIHTLYRIADVLKIDIYDLLPKNTQEVDGKIAHVAIHNLAENIGLDTIDNEQELKKIIDRINGLKRG